MTSNAIGNIANFNNNNYDPDNEIHNNHHRIGTSATEIELLDELPPPFAPAVTTHEHDQQKQSNNYHTLSHNRTQPKANVVYQDAHDQQLGYAVDKLLEKYAPDAAPHNLTNTTTSRRLPAQASVPTEHNESLVSSFQTNHPSMSTTAPSHSYSSIIRPNTSQFSQSQPRLDQTSTNHTTQSSLHSRPNSSYDNFQHSIPPSQQPKPSKSTLPIKTKDGLVTQVIPGKLYTLEDDPLHLLYDRQETTSSNHPSSFQSTFQPSLNVQHTQDPLSSPLYTNTSQRYPHQSSSITTDPTVNNHMQPFDLGNLIKRVQEDYLREIQPFVSSVKFVEKDKEFGQNLNDIGFSTPVTVRKGFTRQADDILRNSFGGRNHQRRQPQHQYDSNEYSDESDYSDDDNINELRSPNRQHPLQKFDSKQSFTSVTSASTHDSDHDNRGVPINPRKKKAEVHDQGTSPPPRLNQTNTRSGGLKPLGDPTTISSKPIPANEDSVSTVNRPEGVKLAARISSGQYSRNSMGSTGSDSEDDYTAPYSDHDHPTNTPSRLPQSVNTLAVTTPVVQPVSGARDRNAVANQVPLRSEDIRPTPPTIRPATNGHNPAQGSGTERSGSEMSGSDQVSDSEDDKKPSIPTNPVPPSTTSRSNVQQNPATTPGGRSATTGPPPNSRDTVAANPPTTSRTTVENNARGAAGASTNPGTTARTTVENNARSAVAAGNAPTNARTTVENNARAAAGAGAVVNPNLHFVPPDQRNAGGDRGAQAAASNQPPAASAAAAQTGSTRLFHGDNDAKGKRSIKDAPTAVGNKIKSLFRRK
ncbi:hypothetical protein I4U23_019065 [Adineta vaga]|nr:hypothetical protein I4U23_019065 [Adineta vaga]